jgi:hypothetical protein
MCLLRRSRIAGHPPPLPRLCRRRIGFRCLSVSCAPVWAGIGVRHPLHPGKTRPATPSGARHPGAGQVGHRISTSAIITVLQHEPRSDQPPHAPRQESPLCALNAGSPAPRSARPAKLSLGQGPPRARALTSTSPAIARWEALPRPDRLGHPMSQLYACADRRSRTQVERDHVPAESPAAGAQRRRPCKGCGRSSSAKRNVSRAPEVPSIDKQPT